MENYFRASGPDVPRLVTIEVGSPDNKFSVPLALLTEKSQYFKTMFERGFLEDQNGAADMKLVPGCVTPTTFNLFLRWLLKDRIEYDGQPDGSDMPITERLTTLIALARYADYILCPQLSQAVAGAVLVILRNIAVPFIPPVAPSVGLENDQTSNDSSGNDGNETEGDDDAHDAHDAHEADEADAASSASGNNSLDAEDHEFDHLDPGQSPRSYLDDSDANTRYLQSAHIVQAMRLPGDDPIRRLIIGACLKGYLTRRPFRFQYMFEKHPRFAKDMSQRVAELLDETTSFSDGSVFFTDPITEGRCPMFPAPGSRWSRAGPGRRHEPSQGFRLR
ncbi:hypothetical protein N7540_000788 [Penicillium herquei]|nr:hypothetical protein N7540_000788 [Penicillium herquei]